MEANHAWIQRWGWGGGGGQGSRPPPPEKIQKYYNRAIRVRLATSILYDTLTKIVLTTGVSLMMAGFVFQGIRTSITKKPYI